MPRAAALRLRDIAAALRRLREYQRRRHTMADPFTRDMMLSAVERQFEIIGEAIKNLPAETTARHPDVAWSDFARFRDYLSHQYHNVEPMNVEAAVDLHLESLETAIDAEIARLDRETE